jgi:hypothetical protein
MRLSNIMMVYRKYRPNSQWGKMNTRMFKRQLRSINDKNMPQFTIPKSIQVMEIFDYKL